MKYILLTMLLSVSHVVCADTQSKVKQVVVDNLRFTENEKIEKGLSTIHTESPIYSTQRSTLVYIAEKYDLDYELLSFSFISEHEEYTYARVKFETTGIRGEDFKDNVIDAVWVFKKQNDTWKYWNQSILNLEYK